MSRVIIQAKTMIRLNYILIIISITLICVFAQNFYDDKYDEIDINGILANNKLREQYYKCFVDQGPCVTADAKFFRDIIKEAYMTDCKKCNEKQKVMLNTVINWFKTNQLDKFNIFVEKAKKDFQKDTV